MRACRLMGSFFLTIFVGITYMGATRFFADKLHADMVVLNGNVITADIREPRAEAIAVKGEHIIAVGPNSEIRPLVGAATLVLDARGKTITPGFIDAHAHPAPLYPETSRLAILDLAPPRVQSLQDLLKVLGEKVRNTPKGEAVRGRGYDDWKIGRHPTRQDLDRVSTSHPILITHSSGHLTAVNSTALRMAGITRETPDPPGGAFDREEKGEPNGVCREGAATLVARRIPSAKPTKEEAVEGMRVAFGQFLSKGLTGITEAGAGPEKFRLYQDTLEAGARMRVNFMFSADHLAELKQLGLRTPFGNAYLRIGAIKAFHGNSLSGRTCWLYEPYADRPDYYGIPPGRSQQELDKLILEIHEAGFQASIHSNGDREIDMLLSAYEKALQTLPRANHRHRIEHASVVNERILKKAKDLGLVLALHSYIYEHGDKMEPYGEKRWDMMHANRSALDLGIPVAGNSDYPVSAADPLLRIEDLVTRRSAGGKVYGPRQRISPEEAIRTWTLGSAFASFDERTRGSIEAGKLADFIVLSADPTRVAPEDISGIKVESTILGGRIAFQAK